MIKFLKQHTNNNHLHLIKNLINSTNQRRVVQNIFLLLALVVLIGISSNHAYSQEIRLATFQETAQVIIDKTISEKITASITLQSTSTQEITIPPELEQKIRENSRISAVTLTNQDQCVLGVNNESCILINVKRDNADSNFLEIQNSTLKISDSLIDEINEAFDTKAELHSTFIHTNDQSSVALETSGVISGKGMVSAVYTMPMEDTNSMYEKISGMLIPKTIRDSGGFYEIGWNLSSQEDSKMTFSIIPSENKSLLQLRVSADHTEITSDITEVNPLEIFDIESLSRSDYFSTGFYPLNSIIQIVILSPEETNVSNVNGNVLETQVVDNEKIPTDITKNGWVFDPEEGKRIQGKYIFGEKMSIDKEELIFSLGEDKKTIENPVKKTDTDESIVVVAIITIVAIGAAIFYLKGYKK